MFIIRRAVDKDIFQVKRLLKEAGLNDQGIEQYYQHFFVVETGEENVPAQLAGAAGMELYEPYGLLRSFVLERAPWNSRVGLQLIHILLSYAGQLKLSQVYLLTSSSTTFFEQMGFTVIPFKELPEEIQESEHIVQAGSKGTLMVYQCFPSNQH